MLRQIPRRTPNMRATSPARVGLLKVMVQLLPLDDGSAGSDRRSIGFTGADAHRGFEVEDEYLAVADLTGFRRTRNGFDGPADLVGRNRHFDLDLRQETHGVFGAAINFRVPLLAPVSFD